VAKQGAAWLSRVQRGLVGCIVVKTGCGMAKWLSGGTGLLYGSPWLENCLAPLPLFRPGKSRSRKAMMQIFPITSAGMSAHHQG